MVGIAADYTAGPDRFEMGRVINHCFGAISRNIGVFSALTALLVFAPGLVTRVLFTDVSPGASPMAMLFPILGSTLISMFFGYVLQAALSYATVVDLNGKRARFGEALKIGLRYALPLLLLAILSMLGIYFGLLLLIVPGIILAVMWSVSTPAMVAEKLGVFASLGRSKQLTKGARWSIFGLLLVALVLLVVPAMLVPLFGGAMPVSPFMALTPGLVVATLLSAAATMVYSALVAAIYVELRTIREGTTVDELASIFA